MKSPLMFLAAAILVASPCLAAPAFSISDIQVSESDGTAVFTVTLSEASPDVVWVNWDTQSGSASGPGDYTPITSASLFIAPDQLSGEITVPLVNDGDGELAEDFYVNLSSPSPGTSIADAQGRATIAESDITTLTWDPGSAQFGTAVQTGTSVAPGYRYFKIQTQAADGGWRSALQVTAGQANLYASRNSLPIPAAHEKGSANAGSDGWVFRPDQFSPGETWYFLVETTTTANWRLYSGDIFIQNLGTLQYTDSDFSGTYNIGEPVLPSGSGPVAVGPEGMHFFSSTVPNGTPAWSLWLNGDSRPLAVRQATVPYIDSIRDHLQNGAMLLVPPYLDGSSTYFFSLNGTPGETVNLDSRIQAVSDIAFDTVQTAINVNNAPFRVYRVQVPIDQIAWDVSTTRLAGNPNVCVRRNNVPSQWFNDAFSEVPGASNDSLTLVPPFLTNDTWFITVYSDGNYQFTLDNGPPEITPMAYVDFKQNDQDARAGWRFYGVTNIPSQTGSLGWQLSLADHVPGTEIALRRNAVPGRWNYRNAFDGFIYPNSGYVTEASTSGLLQQPGHQADIWYVGIYQPAEPLGDFKLTAAKIEPPALGFNNASTNQSGQIRNSARWFQVEVPPGVLGWDLRLRDITSGNPKLVVGRDLLPSSIGTNVNGGYWQPSWSDTWPSGGIWAQAVDWTSRTYDADSSNRNHHRFMAGIGHPLEPGTYYVGVFNDSGDQGAYVLESRGIGSGQAYTVTNLAFNGGTASITSLEPREPRYFKVSVPADQRSWEITLDASVGEMMFTVRQGALPDSEPTYLPFTHNSPSREAKIQKTDDERYVILPPDGTDYLTAGDYYIAVVSEGQSPFGNDYTGTGNSSGTLTSHGPLALTSLGAANLSGNSVPVSVAAGGRKAYSFTVAPGTLLIELRLENRTGNPQFAMTPGLRLPPGNGIGFPPYGSEGGHHGSTISHPELITLANPTPGDYRVTVSGVDLDVSTATLSLRAVVPPALAFNAGTATVTDQQANGWKYFRVEVPAGVAGWDVRLRDVTGNGAPLMVVCRDILPAFVGNSFWFPTTVSSWPSAYSWTQGLDWTTRYADASGENRGNRRFMAAMGKPLEVGTYYVGVQNTDPNNPTSYVIESRGIGSGQDYPITDLAFTAGSSAAITNLHPREPRYFKVSVPPNTRNWQIDLDLTLGEMMFMVRYGAVPDSDPVGGNTQVITGSAEFRVQRLGAEHHLIMPPDETDFLVPGDYYIAVVAEGQDPPPTNFTGTGPCSGTLTSRGSLTDIDLGSATQTGIGGPISVPETHLKSYRFSVPPGTATLEMRLNNRTGNPMMSVVTGPRIARPIAFGPAYGFEGGQATSAMGNLYDAELITIPNPPTGEYHLTVSADWDFGIGTWTAASADLLIQAVPPTNLAFNGGEQSVSNQQTDSWKYFRVVVPSGPLGWDLRLRDVSGGTPQMVVARDSLPPQVSTTYLWSPPLATQWLPGQQWTQGVDWTSRTYDPGFVNVNYQHFSAAMGHPLEPGTYYVGIFNSGGSLASYTLESRGIGSGQAISVGTLGFAGGSSVPVNGLAPREARYFKVTVPANTPAWELTLDPSVGEMMMTVRRGYLPDVETPGSPSTQNDGSLEFKVQKDGPERHVILPPNTGDYLIAGDYYIAVIGEGENPPASNIVGSDPSSGTLTSHGIPAVSNLGNATVAGIHQALALEPGQSKFYRFTVLPGTSTLELRLNNRAGNPQFGVVSGLRRSPGAGGIYANGYYGSEGGQTSGSPGFTIDDDLITIPNPPPGDYSLAVGGLYNTNAGAWTPATADLLIRQKPPEPLNFAASQNPGGGSNTDTRQMINGERTTYAVNIPVQLGGNAVLGWKLQVSTTQGTARLRIYRYAGDPAPYSMVQVNERTAIIVPPWLTLGDTWYAEVEAQGFTEYTITSSPVELNRNPWTMPASFNTAVGDSGVANNGTPLPGDQGVDLAQDDWHFYAIDVPSNNGGLLRTELQAISGNPDLYLREDGVPTTHHRSGGEFPYGVPLVDRSLTGSTSDYGNWVPLNGRTETRLKPGRWYLGVKAAGNSNVRYRLKADTGSVTNLNLNHAPLANQTMAGGDWRFYRFTVPLDAPSPWLLTFSQQLGDVVMYIRDTVPPGNMEATQFVAAWDRDNKNQHPYPSYDPAGTHTIAPPQLRPGHTYFAGFRAIGDATFTVSSAYSTTTGIFPSIAFSGGTYSGNIPPGGSTMITVAAPADAFRWKHTSVHSGGIQIRIEQGSLAQATGDVHYNSNGNIDSSLNTLTNSWPWVPNQIYWIRFVNTTGGTLPVSFTMNGTTLVTDDDDGDGVPDAWEVEMFGSATPYNGTSDPDMDSLPNLLEYAFNLPPLSAGLPIVTPGSGLSGLPSVTVVEVSGQKRIRIEYLRRKLGPAVYQPQVSHTLLDSGPGAWLAPAGTPAITPINSMWERVVVDDTAGSGLPDRFGRVKVTSP